MKVFFSILFLSVIVFSSFSYEIGGAFSLDCFNNPVEESAPSPFQERLLLFHILDVKGFNLRSGLGVLGAYYEIQNDTPVFGDYWSGFHTVEIDLFTYPGFTLDLNKSVNLGVSAGLGVRLPIVSEVDDDLNIDYKNAFNWFYKDLHFLFVGGSLSSRIKLPLGDDSFRLFLSANYSRFVTRSDQWTIGATAGMLWLVN